MTPTVPSPLPSSITGRLIQETQHDGQEAVDCSELPQLIEVHKKLLRQVGRYLMALWVISHLGNAF
jgi:hypothetical protein